MVWVWLLRAYNKYSKCTISHTELCLARHEKVNDVDVDVLSLSVPLHKKPDTVWVCYINSLCCINPATIFQSANSNVTCGSISLCAGLDYAWVMSSSNCIYEFYVLHTRDSSARTWKCNFHFMVYWTNKLRKIESGPIKKNALFDKL